MFNNILGNDNIKELLTNAVKNNKASHSYMFVGTEGIGKKLIAKEFAKMILCTDENKYFSGNPVLARPAAKATAVGRAVKKYPGKGVGGSARFTGVWCLTKNGGP